MNAVEKTQASQPVAANPAEALAAQIESLRSGAHFKNYLRVRDAIFACLAEMDQGTAAPSAYWREEVSGFDYMFDASPLIIEKLREHCYHLTGIVSYTYRHHHAHRTEGFAMKLHRLSKKDEMDMFVPESPVLGGFGHIVDGQLINIDTLKFYECLIAIQQAGFLSDLNADPERQEVWLEIGAGWGGFGYTVKTRFPKNTYVIVDLPQTMLFSATYLISAFPEAKVALYPEVSLDEISRNLRDYDFVFIPHYLFPQADFHIDLAVNMVSFQEMTSEQVGGYVAHLAKIGCPHLYSLNKDRSRYNAELSAVTALIEENYGPTRRISMFDYPYTVVTPPKVPMRHPNLIAKALGAKPRPAGTRRERETDYRHLVAERKA
jgi:putative sugar O-methyltransferase